MLQQILRDMYIDPELLAELDEEQKQVLFCKMREEQVSKWREKELKLEKEDRKRPPKPKKPGGKVVGFQLGKDGNPWVWVMGEHQNDKSIDDIIEEEAHEQAHKMAEEEAEELRHQEEEDMKLKLQEENERLEQIQRQKEEELKTKAEEAALYQSIKEARLAAEKLEEEKKKEEEERRKRIQVLRKKHEMRRQKSTQEVEELKTRRSSEIYLSYKEARHEYEKQAEENSKTVEEAWEEQERKSRLAEEEMRSIARRAREEHRRSLSDLKLKAQTGTQVIGVLMKTLNDVRENNQREKPPLPASETNTQQQPSRAVQKPGCCLLQ